MSVALLPLLADAIAEDIFAGDLSGSHNAGCGSYQRCRTDGPPSTCPGTSNASKVSLSLRLASSARANVNANSVSPRLPSTLVHCGCFSIVGRIFASTSEKERLRLNRRIAALVSRQLR